MTAGHKITLGLALLLAGGLALAGYGWLGENDARLRAETTSASAQKDNYGGCQVMISADGGNSYNSAGDPLVGGAVTGVTTVDWLAASDPDTTNNLAVNLSESLGVLESYQVSDEDNFLYPCYVAGAAPPASPMS